MIGLFSALLAVSGCGSKNADGSGSNGGNGIGNGDGTGGNTLDGGGTAVGDGGSTGGDGSTAGGNRDGGRRPGPGNGMEEVCDGTDTNGDGIIDNVDVNGDGICDCLLLATLGQAGRWGQGDVFAAWLDERSDNGATDLSDMVLTDELLAPFQVIVVQDVSAIGRSYADAEVQALRRWVENGGGLMTLIGYGNSSERANVNRLLAPMDLWYESTQILQKVGNQTIAITDFSEHPTTMAVRAVGVDNGYPVAGSGTVVARGGGYDVARVREFGNGRVFVWGDEWITYNSEWVTRPDYQVELFWVNIIKWLTPVNECQVPIPPILVI